MFPECGKFYGTNNLISSTNKPEGKKMGDGVTYRLRQRLTKCNVWTRMNPDLNLATAKKCV